MTKVALNQIEKQSRKVVVAMSPRKSLRDFAGQAGGTEKKRVVVAMSGGVDSSVAAALLKKQGFDVVGVFMRFWKEGRSGRNTCCSAGAEQAARNVAAKLGIPFYILRLEKEFKKEVVDYFLKETTIGRTPNPCIVCNKKIKFGLMMEKALSIGVDFVATGHYARLQRKIRNQKSEILNKSKILNFKSQTKLFKGKDSNKDQSYFLYTLMQKQLNRVIFPLGDYTKEKVYQMAKKWRLPFRQGESFDLCFVANDTQSFLKKYLKIKPGKIMDLAGQVLGEHPGLAYYTIGQRKNLPLVGLPAPWRGPWWAVKKDNRKNILYVSNDEKDLYRKELIVSDVNWVDGQPLNMPTRVWAKIRYKSEAAMATLRQAQDKNQLKLIFEKPQRAPTPGQSVVFCSKKGEVLGGGIIDASF